MAMKSITRVRLWPIMCVFLLALVATACGSVEDSPTGPSPAPAPSPTPPPTPQPDPAPPPPPPPTNDPGRLEISIDPNPVDWKDGDSSCPNRWEWTQVLRNTGGQRITLTERVNYQDGHLFGGGPVSDNIGIDPGQEFRRPTFVCLATSTSHTFRTDWSGSDSAGNRIAVEGPEVTLRGR